MTRPPVRQPTLLGIPEPLHEDQPTKGQAFITLHHAAVLYAARQDADSFEALAAAVATARALKLY